MREYIPEAVLVVVVGLRGMTEVGASGAPGAPGENEDIFPTDDPPADAEDTVAARLRFLFLLVAAFGAGAGA